MAKSLGPYENPQRYFELKAPRDAKSLADALEATFPKNLNLRQTLLGLQGELFKKAARNIDYGTPEALEVALAKVYKSRELAQVAAASGFKPVKRSFKIPKTRGKGFRKKRASITAFTKRPSIQKELARNKVVWATTRGSLRTATPRQAAAWRRLMKGIKPV